jgi:MFS family permease
VLWNIALYSTAPFFGTYAINELGFTMTAVSVISAAYAIFRAVISRPLGAFGDKTNFVNNLTIGITAFALALGAMLIGGRVSYIVYYMLYAVTMACTNASLIVLIFEHVPLEKRANSIAVLYSLGGILGFLTTLAVRPLVNYIQACGNKFLFLEGVYAQQVVSVIGIIFAIAAILYANIVIRRLPRRPKMLLADDTAENTAKSK